MTGIQDMPAARSRRILEHREADRPGFAADYRCKKLIYYEWYRDIRDAIARESRLKKNGRARSAISTAKLLSWWPPFASLVR
jgi:putative endonuclease